MEKLIINGGKPLFGDIEVSGMKNAALPVILACIAIDDICVIENVRRRNVRHIYLLKFQLLLISGRNLPSRSTCTIPQCNRCSEKKQGKSGTGDAA